MGLRRNLCDGSDTSEPCSLSSRPTHRLWHSLRARLVRALQIVPTSLHADMLSSCCPAGTYCKIDSNNNVGCCLYADSCYGEIVGNNGQYPTSYYQSTYYPSTTYVQPSTVYVTQPQAGTTVYAPVVAATQPVVTTYAPVVAVTQPVVTTYGPSTLQTQAAYAGYCSTLRENGPNLPTTGAGSCGTILIVAGAGRLDMDMIPWTALFMVVQLIMIQ